MPKHQLRPQGEFPSASLIRRCAAIFYDFLLSIALLMVVTLLYKMAQMKEAGLIDPGADAAFARAR